jgi:hypothetical protein
MFGIAASLAAGGGSIGEALGDTFETIAAHERGGRFGPMVRGSGSERDGRAGPLGGSTATLAT